MNPDRWRRACEVFERVAPLPVHERSALLTQACGEDVELRRQVESLLANEVQASSAFEQLPRAVERVLSAEVREGHVATGELLGDGLVGARVGGHHIKSVIGRGAFSTVYEAVQESPHRVVALKVMKPDVPSRSALRRFQFESQTLARLRHPCIAQVYEAGLHSDGRPWFAMEFVPGARPITEYVRLKGLDVRERMELMAQVCDAVEHGHQKGIIHRDLKPANILVDSVGQPKVIDFGVARATDSDMAVTTQQTRVGDLVGTVQYMSPEQCDADPHGVDTRSDVYSLGVVLYELLTGAVPYDVSSTTIYNAVTLVKEREPADLSQLCPRLPRDVEAIVLKALAKDRARRYRSAGDMREDVLRYLRGDAVEARVPTGWDRAVRWVGRHPIGITALVCLALGASITSGLIASGWFILSRQVHALRLSPDKRAVHLIDRLRMPLGMEWRTHFDRGFSIAELVQHRTSNGVRHLLLLNFAHAEDRFPGLCAFNAVAPDKPPIWVGRIRDREDIPERVRNLHPEHFHCTWAFLADVFDDDEPEIVARFASPNSIQCIRVYDLDGNTRYQVWHDGLIQDLLWIKDSGLLVFAGIDQASPNDAEGRQKSEQPDPRVVFAQRPQSGDVGTELLTYERGESSNRVHWCWNFDFPAVRGRWKAIYPDADLSLGTSIPGTRSVCYGLSLVQEGVSWSWDVSEDGSQVTAAHANDDYDRLLHRKKADEEWRWLPELEELKLTVCNHNPHMHKESDASTGGE